jgi:hypothetical protein
MSWSRERRSEHPHERKLRQAIAAERRLKRRRAGGPSPEQVRALVDLMLLLR